MNIAVTYENGQVFQHFGHTQQFKVYQVEDGRVLSSRIEETGESGHGALAGFLKEHGVDTLLCGGSAGCQDGAGTGRYPPVPEASSAARTRRWRISWPESSGSIRTYTAAIMGTITTATAETTTAAVRERAAISVTAENQTPLKQKAGRFERPAFSSSFQCRQAGTRIFSSSSVNAS